MTVYCILIFLILIGYIILNSFGKRLRIPTKKREKIFLVFAWIVLSYVAGMRAYSVGADTITYAYYFRIGNASHFEIGYSLLCDLLRLFTDNPSVLFWACALITNGIVLYVIYRQSPYKVLSVYIYISMYFYFNSFNSMRQYIAIAFVFLAYDYLTKKRLIIYWLFILMAFSFHRTAIVIGLLLFFVIHFKQNSSNMFTTKYYCIIVGGIFVGLFLDKMIAIFTQWFPSYEFFLEDGRSFLERTGGVQELLVYSLIFLAGILFIPKAQKNSQQLRLIMCMVVVLSVVSLKLAMVVRFIWYLDIYTILVIPNIVIGAKDRKQRMMLLIILVTATTLLMFYNLSVGKQRVADYQFVF